MGRKFKRIFFATDLHGSEIVFRKFVGAAEYYHADTMVLGGDITGKVIVPIVQVGDGTYTSKGLGQDWKLQGQEQLAAFEDKIRNTGYYPYLTSTAEMETLTPNSPEVNQLFLKFMIETLRRWVSLAEEKLGSKGIMCYVTGGNDDPAEIMEAFRGSQTVIEAEGKVVRIDDSHEMISLGYSNPTPWNLPRDVPEEKIAELIEEMASKVENMKSCFFNLHAPPKNTLLDQCQLLDSSVDPPQIVLKNGQPVIFGAGSQAVADAIKKYQPMAGLHGHIHESKAIEKIGRTTCFNPGSEYSEGILRGLILNYEGDKILSYQFTSG